MGGKRLKVCGQSMGEPAHSGLRGRPPVGECWGASRCAGGAGLEELCDWLICLQRRHAEVMGCNSKAKPPAGRRKHCGTRFCAMVSIPSSSNVPRPLHRAGAKDDGRRLTCWPTACAPIGTLRRVERRPVMCSARAGCADGRRAQQERARLGQPTCVSSSGAIPQDARSSLTTSPRMVSRLGEQAPTPAKAGPMRETTIERFLSKRTAWGPWQAAPEVCAS